jgi:hypothetical protein
MGATTKLFLDGYAGSGDTYIYEESADDLHIVVGGVAMMQFDQDIGATVISADGSAPLDQALFSLRGAFTSGGGGTDAEYFLLGGTLNSASGDTRNVGVINIDGAINTQAVSETTTAVASLIINEPNIAKGSGHTITTAASLYIVDAPTEGNTNNAAIYVAGGNIIHGGNWMAGSNANGYLRFYGDPSSSVGMTFDDDGTLFIGDDANTNMTIGLTINQASTDDEIMAFKSSDISHGMTDTVETDTFGSFRKQEAGANGGGLRISGYSDTNTYKALVLEAFSADATPDLTDTSNSAGVMEFNAGVISGTDITNVPAGANAFAFGTSDLTDSATVMVIKGNGDVHQTTDAHTALDDMADAELIRAYEVERAPDQVIKDKWDDIVRYNEADLIAAGIFGVEGRKGLTNTSQLMRLHSGAIWQGHAAHMSLAEKVEGLEVELIEAKKQLAAISA